MLLLNDIYWIIECIRFTILTTPSDEDSSNPRKAGIAAGGVVLMSKGPSQSPLEGEFL